MSALAEIVKWACVAIAAAGIALLWVLVAFCVYSDIRRAGT